MAWVRIHDGALSHPKIAGLVDWRNPFCVWVWGLSYCQLHLTDGRVVKAAIPNKDALRAAAQLVARGLWQDDGDAFTVHDYLDWNDSKADIQSKRDHARARVSKYREQRNASLKSDDVTRNKRRTSSSGVDVSFSGGSGISEGEPEGKPSGGIPATSRRDRDYGRIFLFAWQQHALIASLGPHAEAFALDEFLDGLSAKADAKGITFPNKDIRWAWVQAQLAEECARRGLPVASAESGPTNKRIAGLMRGGEAFLQRVAESKAGAR